MEPNPKHGRCIVREVGVVIMVQMQDVHHDGGGNKINNNRSTIGQAIITFTFLVLFSGYQSLIY